MLIGCTVCECHFPEDCTVAQYCIRYVDVTSERIGGSFQSTSRLLGSIPFGRVTMQHHLARRLAAHFLSFTVLAAHVLSRPFARTVAVVRGQASQLCGWPELPGEGTHTVPPMSVSVEAERKPTQWLVGQTYADRRCLASLAIQGSKQSSHQSSGLPFGSSVVWQGVVNVM